MPDYFTEIDVLRSGDSAGNGMTLRLTDGYGRTIHTVAVPQEGHSHTGPTWAYIFENEGLTLIDPGAEASFEILRSGMALCGLEASGHRARRSSPTATPTTTAGWLASSSSPAPSSGLTISTSHCCPSTPETCRWRPIRPSKRPCGPPPVPTVSRPSDSDERRPLYGVPPLAPGGAHRYRPRRTTGHACPICTRPATPPTKSARYDR